MTRGMIFDKSTLERTSSFSLSGANSSVTADFTYWNEGGKGHIIWVGVFSTATTGTAYTSWDTEVYNTNAASSPTEDGANTKYLSTADAKQTGGRIVNDGEYEPIPWTNVATVQVGVLSIKITANGGDGTSGESVTANIICSQNE